VFDLFSCNFFLQTLMQKFLSLGAECVRIQESADASQGMSIVIRGFLLLYPCSFVFPRLLNVLFLLFVVL
jgi:hypothetical protein